MSQRERIGLFGGTFDPVHIGHTVVAEWMLHHFDLSKIFFIPNRIHPFQKRKDVTSATSRLEMLSLALKDFPDFEIDRFELDQPGVSYTIDTVRYFAHKYPESDLCLIIGSDICAEFDAWKEPHAILQMAKVLVYKRREAGKPDPLQAEAFIYTESPLIEISSSQVRDAVRQGIPFRSLVDPRVYQFILSQRLYRD